ncbi:MAG: hypothetical protein RLZZ584_1149 [Pseudomonadota bacterium]|jgi:nicotinamidase-related amidase
MTTALLIIDVQQALCSGRWACHEVDQVITRINAVAARARAAGAPVVLIQHESQDGPLDHGSSGWRLAEGNITLANGVLDPPQIVAHHNRRLGHIESFGVRVDVTPAAQLAWPAA